MNQPLVVSALSLIGASIALGCAGSKSTAEARPAEPSSAPLEIAASGSSAGEPRDLAGVVQVSGRFVDSSGEPRPAGREELGVLWIVSATSPDYGFLFGRGRVEGDRFELALGCAPPRDALNAGMFGVGILVLLDSECALAEGKVARNEWERCARLGHSTRQAIIYTTPALADYTDEKGTLGWLKDLPLGYTCGRCVDTVSQTFDTYEPFDCAEMEIVLGPVSDMCNWT